MRNAQTISETRGPDQPVHTPDEVRNHRGEPESHMNALPPPWSAYPPPIRANAIVTAARLRKPLRVSAVPSGHALWLVDGDPERLGLTWARLLLLADHMPILLSLGAMASAIGEAAPGVAQVQVSLRRGRPRCARVENASFVTRGFALHDAFWYGWRERGGDRYVQRYLAQTSGLRRFCKSVGLHTVLVTEAESERASGHPLCLFRAGRRGFLLALDAEPPPSCAGAVPVSPYMKRLGDQALGLRGPERGQYVATPCSRQEYLETLSGLCDRFTALRWVPCYARGADDGVPDAWVDYTAEDDGGDASTSTPLPVLLRTGFSPSEWDLVLGVATFLKQIAGRRDRRGRTPRVRRGLPRRIQWIPLVCPAAVPPAADPKDYRYLVTVPAERRRKPNERPSRARVRIDLKRSAGAAIEVVAATRTAGRPVAGSLRALTRRLGIDVRVETARAGRKGPETWELRFPVEPGPDRYDAIVATERVIQVLDAVLRASVRP